jgi:hypothetical protein
MLVIVTPVFAVVAVAVVVVTGTSPQKKVGQTQVRVVSDGRDQMGGLSEQHDALTR